MKPSNEIWTEEAIKKTAKIIKKAKQNKHHMIKFLDKTIFWLILPFIIFGNILVSIFLIPALLGLNGFFIYFIVALVGFSFGFLFQILLHDIEDLDKHHHILYGIFIPIMAIVNYIVIVQIVNFNLLLLDIPIQHNGGLIGLTYAIFFLIPYIFNHLIKK